MQFSMQHGSFGKLGKVAVGVAAVAAIVGSIALIRYQPIMHLLLNLTQTDRLSFEGR